MTLVTVLRRAWRADGRPLRKDQAAIHTYLAPLLTAVEFRRVDSFLDEVARAVAGESTQQVPRALCRRLPSSGCRRVCAAPLLEQGLRLESTFATSKTIPELLRYLRSLEGRTFDVIFFSPYSYEFHLGYSHLRFLRSAFISGEKLDAVLAGAKADTLSVMRLLGGLFEAPIFVHNTSGIRRHDGSIRELAKNRLTQRTRSMARRGVNEWLPGQSMRSTARATCTSSCWMRLACCVPAPKMSSAVTSTTWACNIRQSWDAPSPGCISM